MLPVSCKASGSHLPLLIYPRVSQPQHHWLCVGSHLVHWKIFSGIPDIDTAEANSMPSPVLINANVPRHYQVFPGRENFPHWEWLSCTIRLKYLQNRFIEPLWGENLINIFSIFKKKEHAFANVIYYQTNSILLISCDMQTKSIKRFFP